MKKLYRSKTDQKIAGVCGGLGEYFQMDSVFFRILFLVIVLLGGMGILVYLIMWVIVPMNSAETIQITVNKRFSLSTQDRKIAGVCGGLGEFFGIDPVIFRIIFVVLAFLGGIGIFLYLILWLVAPKKNRKDALKIKEAP